MAFIYATYLGYPAEELNSFIWHTRLVVQGMENQKCNRIALNNLKLTQHPILYSVNYREWKHVCSYVHSFSQGSSDLSVAQELLHAGKSLIPCVGDYVHLRVVEKSRLFLLASESSQPQTEH